MRRSWVLLLGVAIGVALILPLTALAEGREQEDVSATHSTMHAMMDAMRREGSSERMHEAMPGSEAMVEHCVSMREAQDMGGMMRGGEMMGRHGGTMTMMRGMGTR